ncbi:paxillin isoform X3 [Condylostylus longicornis]|uniref:paxillin isoform X3 n=1 Tax=Condylostylus longicornis TaxID=2530218 RepID=UPI00244DFDE6|nr:paxillin isoform X3 [Condylostylus longicornis]
MDDLDALLADLQNSVPGHLNSSSTIHTTYQSGGGPAGGGGGGYGSLKGKNTPQSPTVKQHFVEQTTTRTTTNPAFNGHHQTSHNNSFHHNSGGLSSLSRNQPRSSTPQNSSNLTELDSLLEDLSNARYNANLEKKNEHIHSNYPNKNVISSTTSSAYNTIESNKRPTVDSLLEELSSASNNQIYAVPNGGSTSPLPSVPGRKHVTITVRETKTEKLTPVASGTPEIHEEVIQQREAISTDASPAGHHRVYASSATKELDDLMASLSDFKNINTLPTSQIIELQLKMKVHYRQDKPTKTSEKDEIEKNKKINSSSHHHQTVTDYAKPNKGVSSAYQTITQTEEHFIREEDDYRQGDQLDSMLGNLQANMSRQGVNTVQKGCCSACEKPIVGQVITALGKTWHPEHFVCNHCNQELGTRNFFEREGFPYCEPDYHNLFSPRCAYCNGAILDKCVTALDKTWHTDHFFCAQCGQPFGEDGFHERDGKPYCRNDYFEMFAPKCNGCNRAIMENYISALNSQWHPDCFVCRDCRQPFQGGSFFDHEGLPYCETHYHAKRGSLCAGCSKPITGRCITAMFKKFHPEHFVCAFCLKQLNKGTFKEQNDKPYCHGCFDKLFG